MNEDEIILECEKEKKRLKTRYILIIIISIIIAAIFSSEFTLYYYTKNNKILTKDDAAQTAEENINVISKTLKNFRKVIDQLYLGDIDEQKILDETIKGYVNGLNDEYSEYMTAEEWEEFQTSALGNYVGIGIFMGVNKDDNIVVLSPVKESPAEKAGLKPGDIIAQVNDESVLGLSSDVVSSKIKGEAGTKVKITVFRESENDYLNFEIERAEIKIYHVETKMLQNNVGYISLMTFDEGCSEEFKNAYNKLKADGAKKIIIDLRNNTGGLVDEALSMIDMFLDKDKTMLITVDSKGNEEVSKSENEPIIDCKDVVVLTNEYSASASEIFVGALKDNGKATIVGTKTYGKGVIQSVFMLEDGSALKLTVNEYFTPNKTKINKVGIEPDYVVEENKETENDEQLDKALEILK